MFILISKLYCSMNVKHDVTVNVWSVTAQRGITELDFQKQPPEVFYKKGFLKNFAKFIGKHLCQSLVFNKVAGFKLATLLKRDSGAVAFL